MAAPFSLRRGPAPLPAPPAGVEPLEARQFFSAGGHFDGFGGRPAHGRAEAHGTAIHRANHFGEVRFASPRREGGLRFVADRRDPPDHRDVPPRGNDRISDRVDFQPSVVQFVPPARVFQMPVAPRPAPAAAPPVVTAPPRQSAAPAPQASTPQAPAPSAPDRAAAVVVRQAPVQPATPRGLASAPRVAKETPAAAPSAVEVLRFTAFAVATTAGGEAAASQTVLLSAAEGFFSAIPFAAGERSMERPFVEAGGLVLPAEVAKACDAVFAAGPAEGVALAATGAAKAAIQSAADRIVPRLFHFPRIDAAIFNDALAAFIDDSAATPEPGTARGTRAWVITGVALVADLALLAYWYRTRAKGSDGPRGISGAHEKSPAAAGR